MDVRRWRETIEVPAGEIEGYRYGIQMHNDLSYIWTIHHTAVEGIEMLPLLYDPAAIKALLERS